MWNVIKNCPFHGNFDIKFGLLTFQASSCFFILSDENDELDKEKDATKRGKRTKRRRTKKREEEGGRGEGGGSVNE